MGSVRHCQNDEENNWVGNLFGRAKGCMGFSSCPSDESDSAIKDAASSIECQTIKADETSDSRCAVTYTDLSEAPPPTPWILTPGALVAIAVALLSISLSGIMWLTSAYDNAILKLVSIRDDIDMVFDLWRLPPTRPTISVYPFHYKNFEAVIEGRELPEVEEKGPYVFREKSQRVNIKFYDNATVSFQEMKNITFDALASNGTMQDNITTPNVPLIVLLKKGSTFYFAEQKILESFLKSLSSEPFNTVSIEDFIWGYEDDFFKALSKFTESWGKDKPKPFGFLAKRRGLHHDVITEKTGSDDLNTIGKIIRWGGASTFGAWGNTSCDILEGSDGTIFPAFSIRNGEPVFVTSKEMCRRIPAKFNATVQSQDGFPAQKYDVDLSMFDYSEQEGANSCYKLEGSYPPVGSFHASPCQNEVPIFFSFPHFLNAGEELKNSIKGLKPDPKRHKTYFLIHKYLGISLSARTRFQLNIMFQKSSFISQSSKLKSEKLILPIAWMDYDSGPFREDFVNVVYHLTYTVRWVETLLKWLLTIIAVMSVIYIVHGVRRNYRIPFNFNCLRV